ncbi:hypothetical protein OSTOST_24926 [Ostertagia ostertagi]
MTPAELKKKLAPVQQRGDKMLQTQNGNRYAAALTSRFIFSQLLVKFFCCPRNNQGATCPGFLGYLHASPYGKLPPMPIWKELNRLASEGKWDNINNMPKLFLFGKAKKEAYSLHHAINTKKDFWSSTPYGQFLKGIFRIVVLVCVIEVSTAFFDCIITTYSYYTDINITFKAGVTLYEFVVPEEKRLHYKYRAKHGHGEGHEHH